jgi:hypothetical protein
LKILELMASGGDIISRKLSIVCLPAGRSNFTNENVERSPAKKKKRKEKRRIETKSPYPLNCCGEA